MGDLIEPSRPPVKACGDCPFCPTPEAEVEGYIAYDEYVYYLSTNSNDYNLSNTLQIGSAFSWRNAPTIGDCSTGSWASNYFYGNNQNSRLGFILKGKVGSTAIISLPYYGYNTSYNVIESDNRTTCSISESNENLGQIGTIKIELEISDEDVLYTNADGTVVAGINASFGEDGESVIIDTNADFALPEAPTNTTYYFESASDEL